MVTSQVLGGEATPGKTQKSPLTEEEKRQKIAEHREKEKRDFPKLFEQRDRFANISRQMIRA